MNFEFEQGGKFALGGEIALSGVHTATRKVGRGWSAVSFRPVPQQPPRVRAAVP